MTEVATFTTGNIWDSETLLAKAQRYIETMLEQERDDWRFALWSSLALELIARAALANYSPALLADTKDRNNLYSALGYEPTAKKVYSEVDNDCGSH